MTKPAPGIATRRMAVTELPFLRAESEATWLPRVPASTPLRPLSNITTINTIYSILADSWQNLRSSLKYPQLTDICIGIPTCPDPQRPSPSAIEQVETHWGSRVTWHKLTSRIQMLQLTTIKSTSRFSFSLSLKSWLVAPKPIAVS